MGQEPFETIVVAHHPEIYRYLRRVTGRASEAEDLSQETFLRAFRAYRRLAPDANVRAWLFAIATNLRRNHARGERRRRAAHESIRSRGRQIEGEGPESEALFKEARSVMEGVIDTLPLKQRLAFVLRKVHDLSYDEIGRSLECSADSARANVFQAFRKLRAGLDGHASPRREDSA
jgi:RNA polymerase sigma-70 factor (ECF subfamily)